MGDNSNLHNLEERRHQPQVSGRQNSENDDNDDPNVESGTSEDARQQHECRPNQQNYGAQRYAHDVGARLRSTVLGSHLQTT